MSAPQASTRGFAALIMTLIVCVGITLIAFSASASAFHVRLSVLETEYKELSRMRAYGCAHAALYALAEDPAYRPSPSGDTVWLTPEVTCRIHSISEDDDLIRIVTEGEYGNSYSYIETGIDLSAPDPPLSFKVLFFREI